MIETAAVIAKAVLWPIVKKAGTEILIDLMEETADQLRPRPDNEVTEQDVERIRQAKKDYLRRKSDGA